MKRKIWLSLSLLIGVFLATNACGSGAGLAERALIGFTADVSNSLFASPAASCTGDVTVQATSVNLVEQGPLGGNQTRSWQAASPFYSQTPEFGGYGVYREEVCFYMVEAFTGTVEIPITSSQAYAGFLSITQTFPVISAGTPLGATLSFTGDGTTGHGTASRQCFNIEAIGDANLISESVDIQLGEITSGDDDGFYTGKNPCDIAVAVEDDDGPGVRVSNISRVMEEPGGSGFTNATFAVRLRTAPTANVTMNVNDLFDPVNTGRREGTATPTTLTFTNGNFSTEQLVTINSVDDLEVDGLKTYTVAVENTSSADPDYNGLNPRDVVIFNNDQSVPGYTYVRFDTTGDSTTAGSAGTVTGFATDEMNNFGSTYSTFTIALRSRPTTNVTLNFSTSAPAISNLMTTSMTFTPSNWNTPQTVTVEGRSNGTDNGSDNGNQDYTISFTVTTTDPTYSTIPRPSFSIRSCDNDNTHLIQPCNFSGMSIGGSGSRFSAAEGAAAASQIWLISKNNPGGTTTVGVSSTDATEGTVSPATVTVDSGNYNTMAAAGTNRIAITHENDLLLDGDQTFTITTAASGGTISYNPADIFGRTTDNEALYYISVSGSTQENSPGTTALIHLCLGANNPDSVQVNAACNGDECGTVTPNVTFPAGTVITAPTPSNAACATDANRRTFTVTGADDAFADGTQTFSVTLTLGNTPLAPYGGTNPPDSGNINNADDESPGKAVFVSPGGAGLITGEMTAAGVQGGDTVCQTNRPSYAPSGTYKAMLVSDSVAPINARVATTDGSTAAGQTDWVLTANYYYYRCDGSGYTNCSDEHKRLFRANSAALIPFPMSMYFSSNAADSMWTGMNGNMTPATQTMTPGKVVGTDPDYRHNCAGFTFEEGPSSPNPTYYANTWTDAGGGNVISNTNIACTGTQRIICVQQ